MADITKLYQLVNGVPRPADITGDSLVITSVKLGAEVLTESDLSDLLAGLTASTNHIASTSNPHSVTKSQILTGNLIVNADVDDDAEIVESKLLLNYSTSTLNTAISDLQTLSGVAANAQNLGTFTGDTIADSSTIKSALQALETAVESAAASVTNEYGDDVFRILDDVDDTKKIAFQASAITTATTRTISMPDADVNLGLIATAIQSSEKGANNGVATLNASGKLTASQVPAIAIVDTYVVADQSAMLALTLAETGDVAVRTDLNKTFILKGTDYSELTDWQELLTPTDAVSSVNGQTGVVVLDSGDISEGTNLYFTDARAKSAAVADSITDSVTDVAPSQNAVFDALALKSDVGHTHAISDVTDLQSALDDKVDKGTAITNTMVAGEEFTTGVYFVRIGTDGKIFKADYDASSNNNFYAYGAVVVSSTIAADSSIEVVLLGEITLAASFFTSGEEGQPVHLKATGTFDAVSQITYSTNQASYRVGIVTAVDKILVGNFQLLGIA